MSKYAGDIVLTYGFMLFTTYKVGCKLGIWDFDGYDEDYTDQYCEIHNVLERFLSSSYNLNDVQTFPDQIETFFGNYSDTII